MTARTEAAALRHRAFERLYASPWSGQALREVIGRFEPRFSKTITYAPCPMGPHSDPFAIGDRQPYITLPPKWSPPNRTDFYAYGFVTPDTA